MTYYYIATESETDRYFYDANKWSETQGGTTPTSRTPAKTDEFVIGESAENFVGTSESPVTFSFASSNTIPKSLVIFGYVSFTGGGGEIVSLRTLTVSFGSATFDATISPSLGGGNLTVTVAEHCALSISNMYYWTNRPITFDLAATASVTIGIYTVLLMSVDSEIVLPNANITNTLRISCRGTHDTFEVSGQISPGSRTILNNVELYNFETVTSAVITTSEPLEISGDFTTTRFGPAFALDGQIDLKLIGTNNQRVLIHSLINVADTFLMNIELTKASGTVAFTGVTANVNGYCGTDAAGNLIPGQSPTSAKVTVSSTSDITFAGETHLAYLTISGTVTANAQTVLYNHVLSGVLNIPTGQAVRCYNSTRNAESQLTGLGNYVLTWGVSETSALGTVTGVSIIDDVETVPIVGAITRVNDDDEQTISWLAASNDYGTAANYDIAVTTCNAAGTETTAAIYDQAVLEYVNSSLTTGSTYGYTVRVTSRGDVGLWTGAKLQPTEITVTEGRNQIDVTIKRAALAGLYCVDYSTSPLFAEYETINYTTPGTKTISGLLSATRYYVRMKTARTHVNPSFPTSDYCDVQNVQTLKNKFATPIITAVPLTNESISVQWTPLSNAGNYLLECATDSIFSNPTQITASENRYTLEDATYLTNYYFRVKALETSRNDESDWSETANTRPLIVVLETPIITDTKSVKIEWNPIENATEYFFEWSYDGQSWRNDNTMIYGTNGIVYNVQKDRYLYLRVKAKGLSYSDSNYSAVFCVFTGNSVESNEINNVFFNEQITIKTFQNVRLTAIVRNNENERIMAEDVESFCYTVYKCCDVPILGLDETFWRNSIVHGFDHVAVEPSDVIDDNVDYVNFSFVPDTREHDMFCSAGRYLIECRMTPTTGNPIVWNYKVEVRQ